MQSARRWFLSRSSRLTSARTRSAMPRAFVHPLWWTALALLVLNDHVLKDARILPSALTGKLSDVAGMLVAPPLLALAFGAQRAASRWLAPAVAGLLLCAIKLSPSAASALEQALTAIGIRSRFWVDATDLWALLALPIGSWLCAPSARALSNPARVVAGRMGIALAAAACLGTGASGDKARSDAPTLKNTTDDTIAFVLTSTEGRGGCRIYRDDRIGILTEDAFIAPREITLKAGEEVDLPDDADTGACGAASIAFADGERELVFWRDLDEIEGFVPDEDDQRLARRMLVKQEQGKWTFDIGDDLSAFELGAMPPEATCEDAAAADSLAFDSLPMAQSFLTIGEVRTDELGCLEVDWFEGPGDPSPQPQRLCIPSWAFPFVEGETLSVAQSTNEDGERALRITRYAGTNIETQLALWNDARELEDSRIEKLKAVDCVGRLSICGAYVRPLEIMLRGRDDALFAGEEASIDGKAPAHTRVLIGDARDVSWSSATCAGPEARLGATANALELREY